MIRTVLVAACLFLSTACVLHRGAGGAPKATPQIDSAKIRVFVSTAAPRSRSFTADEVLRQRSAAQIADGLKDRKGVAVVSSAPEADVLVDVRSAATIFTPRSAATFDEYAIPVDVRAAGQTARIVESGYDQTRTARKVAKDIHRWIQANASTIIAARPPAR